MSYFQRHLFICCNQRHNPYKPSCNDQNEADAALDFLRVNVKKLGLIGPGKLCISSSGCLGRCQSGPAMVIYPQGHWYTYHNEKDLEDILNQVLLNNQNYRTFNDRQKRANRMSKKQVLYHKMVV